MSFKTFIDIIIKLEGGDKIIIDTGGLTKYGISQRAYPNLDIKNLKYDDAVKLYQKDYWEKIKGDEISKVNYLLSFLLLDTAINMGVSTATRLLQETLNKYFKAKLTVDGVIGQKTIEAIAKADKVELCSRFIAERIRRYHEIGDQRYLQGWIYRTIKGLINFFIPDQN